MDIHKTKKHLEQTKERLKREVGPENAKLFLEFARVCQLDGISPGRINRYLQNLIVLHRHLKKNFSEATRKEIEQLVIWIDSQDYKPFTKQFFKVTLRKFYGWLGRDISWIRASIKRNEVKLPTQILTKDEILKLVKHAQTLRNKALIYVLYESGARIGEFLNLKKENVEFDSHGAIIYVHGKTGMRRIRLVASAGLLKEWLESCKTDYLWLIGYRAVSKILRQVAARAGINKPVNPHAFRHARATHLAKKLTEAEMKAFFGWAQSSDMAAVYVHLSGQDLDYKLLDLKKEENNSLKLDMLLNDPEVRSLLAKKLQEYI